MTKPKNNEARCTPFAFFASIERSQGRCLSSFIYRRTFTLGLVLAGLLAPSFPPAWSQVPDPESQFNEAISAQKAGDFKKALSDYEVLVQRFPKNIAVRANLAGLQIDLGHFDEAIANYRVALKLEPANLDLRFGLDSALVDKNDNASLKAAGSDLESFHAQNPEERTATKILAEVYDRQHRYTAVIDLLQPHEAQSNDDDDFKFLLSRAMLQAGQLAQGIGLMDQVAARSGRADAYLAAGQARLSMSQFDLAKKDAEAAINKQPDLPGAETLYGSVLARMGNYQAAEDALQKALAVDPEDFDANYDLGSLAYFNRNLPTASTLLEHALRLRPSSSEARYKLALVQQSRGETRSALSNLERVTRERPDWIEGHAKLSGLYFLEHRQAEGEREAKVVEDLVAKGMQASPPTP